MSEIALYNLLKRIPDATDDEVEKAVSDVASTKEVATKADVKDMATKTYVKAEVERMGRVLIMWIVGVGLAMAGLIITVLKSVPV